MARQRREKRPKNYIVKGFEIAAMGLLAALILRAFIFVGFVMSGGSMENTLLGGDVVLAQRITYRLRAPKPGEIVMFRYPLNPRRYLTSRCIAVGGQTVEIIDKTVYVDGKVFDNPPSVTFTDHEVLDMLFSNRDNFGPFVVPFRHIFVMGDNRDQSNDSRAWGAVPLENVHGKPMFVYYSLAEEHKDFESDDFVDAFMNAFKRFGRYFARLRIGRIGTFPS